MCKPLSAFDQYGHGVVEIGVGVQNVRIREDVRSKSLGLVHQIVCAPSRKAEQGRDSIDADGRNRRAIDSRGRGVSTDGRRNIRDFLDLDRLCSLIRWIVEDIGVSHVQDKQIGQMELL